MAAVKTPPVARSKSALRTADTLVAQPANYRVRPPCRQALVDARAAVLYSSLGADG